MESSITATAISTVTESCNHAQPPPPPPPATNNKTQLLEISLISAQDLAPISKSMQTYAVTWINPNRKHTTRTDQEGNRNPKWNDKIVFRLTESVILEDPTVNVDIYTLSWFRDVLVGTVRVQVSELISPLIQSAQNGGINTRFITLQIRRASGTPQGILNMGVAIVDSATRSMRMQKYEAAENLEQQQNKEEDDELDDETRKLHEKINLWRSLSTGSGLNPGSVCNGSVVNGFENGSELCCSDIGPSASVVAAELSKKLIPPPPPPGKGGNEDTGSSILEDMTYEEAKARGYRVLSKDKWDESELSINGKHGRRNSDGSLFSCFVLGIEFTIVCGGNKNANSNRNGGTKRRKPNEATTSSA